MSGDLKKPCTCQADIQAQLTARFQEKSPEAIGHKVTLTGYAFILNDSGLVTKGCMPLKLEAVYPLKKGGTKAKTQTQNMIFSYCPFCGIEYACQAEAA